MSGQTGNIPRCSVYRGKTFLAIIPARGGSKRLPGKNIRDFNGKPLIAWSIEAALQSRHIDRVIVSSDDDTILKIAESYGADSLKRPPEISGDTAETFDAVKHLLETTTQNYDYTILLQPTSPLRQSRHIDEAIEFLMDKEADAVISVTEMEHSPLWANTLEESLSLENFLDEEAINRRSQDLQTYYRINGALYLCKTQKLLEERSFFLKKNIYAYVMQRRFSIDIDEEIDFRIAQCLMTEQADLQ